MSFSVYVRRLNVFIGSILLYNGVYLLFYTQWESNLVKIY